MEEEFKYLGTTLTNQNSFRKKLRTVWIQGTLAYHSVQSLLSSSLLSKNLKNKIYRNIILPFVLYGFKTWSLTFWKEHRLRVFKNRMLRRIFGPKKDKVRGEWRKLHNEELNDLYSSSNIVYLSGFFNSCRRLPETKRHSSLFLHWSGSKFLIVMVACTPSIHVFLERLLFLLSRCTHSIINFGILSSGIFLTWPYHCTLFLFVMSMTSGFPFTPIISFICSFFLLSIRDFLAHLISTSISVDKISFTLFGW